jgi:hypothetical protein
MGLVGEDWGRMRAGGVEGGSEEEEGEKGSEMSDDKEDAVVEDNEDVTEDDEDEDDDDDEQEVEDLDKVGLCRSVIGGDESSLSSPFSFCGLANLLATVPITVAIIDARIENLPSGLPTFIFPTLLTVLRRLCRLLASTLRCSRTRNFSCLL